MKIEFNLEMAKTLFYLFGNEDSEITVEYIKEGHSGEGLYAHFTEYPEEGSIFLGKNIRGN